MGAITNRIFFAINGIIIVDFMIGIFGIIIIVFTVIIAHTNHSTVGDSSGGTLLKQQYLQYGKNKANSKEVNWQ
jgi:hypothetical protein